MQQVYKIEYRQAKPKLSLKFHFCGASQEHQGIFPVMGGGSWLS